MISRYPSPEQLESFAEQFDLELGDVIRDIARIAAVAHLRAGGFLNENCVLVGGMALRLRGSTRFTIFDTDTSLRNEYLDELGLSDGLTVNTDDLEIEPEGASYWEQRTKLTIAQPIRYRAYFPAGLVPVEDEFSFTVNRRGLNMEAQWLGLRTEYADLLFSKSISVPVMHLTEQTAEKIVAWAAASLAKHYLDLGWIAKSFSAEIKPADLRRQCEAKLRSGREAQPNAYRGLTELADLREPLAEPSRYYGPLNKDRDLKTERIRFTGAAMTLDEARHCVRDHLIPLLFDGP